jgi:hypothetical protein
LPALTFLGHWPEQISIPGTNYYLAIPGTADVESTGAHDHSQHCHADAASCSDVPATAGVSFAIMNETLGLIGAGGIFVLLALRWWVPGEGFNPSPEVKPPRSSVSPC